ncbi:MAG: hypothetical protein ABFC96_09160 [Thermoguttaceae bacterium]
MTEPSSSNRIPLTLHLAADVAARLQMAAASQKRPPEAVAAELLDRYLPRPQAKPQKGSIPYA